MKRMIAVLTVAGVLLSPALCLAAPAQGTNTIKAAGQRSPVSGTKTQAQGTNATMRAGATRVMQVTNVITLTGKITREEKPMTTKDGKTGNVILYVLTEADGTTVMLNNRAHGKNAKGETPTPAVKLADYVGKNATVVGNGYYSVGQDGKKSLVIYSITKIE